MLTGFTWCIPIPDKSAETIVKAYIKNVYSHYGGSRKILSDNGTEFKNKLFSQVAKDLNVECTVPKSCATVNYTLTGVEPHGPTRSV